MVETLLRRGIELRNVTAKCLSSVPLRIKVERSVFDRSHVTHRDAVLVHWQVAIAVEVNLVVQNACATFG
jgi:hypothetical protein